MSTTPKTVTQKDVAQRAGISRSMVAMSLGGHPKISDGTRRRVLEAARELGYDPDVNQGARALIARRHGKKLLTGVLAVVLPENQVALLRSAYFGSIIEGLEAEATARGLELCYMALKNRDRLPKLLINGNVDAVVALNSDGPYKEKLKEHGVPIVDLTGGGIDDHRIAPDGFRGAYLATQHLLALGHTSIGLISHHPIFPASIERQRGWEEAMRARGLHSPALDCSQLYEMRKGPEVLESLLRRVPECTAVVCYNDLIAMDVIGFLQLQGMRVPEDFSVVGFDDTAVLEQFEPELTSVAYDRLAMARRAVAWAAEMASGDFEGRGGENQFPVELKIRHSTGAPKIRA